MAPNNFLISFLLHLVLLFPVTAEQHVYAVPGQPVTLPCPDSTPNHKGVGKSWKRNNKPLFNMYSNGRCGKADRMFRGTVNEFFTLAMPEAEEGIYTCEVAGQTRRFHLHLLKVTGSPDGYLLQGESLELQLHSPDQEEALIEWIGPRNERGNQPRWTLTDNNKKLSIKDLQIQDNGTWICKVHEHRIPYKVTVIGFLSTSDEEIFAAVNSTVTLSYRLNFNPEQNTDLSGVEVLLTQKTSEMPVSLNVSSFFPLKKIHRVQLEDGGWYQCRLTFSRGNLNKTIHLVVMQVVATPQGTLVKGEEVSLCCSISPPLSPGALLRWDSLDDNKDGFHCLQIRMAGLWTCSLVVKEEVKISVNYTVEATTMEQTEFPLIEVALGTGVPLVLLILISVCLSTYATMKRRKQQAERMAQAKQHLLAKRTCQCQRQNSNDYYHT